jgi:hypothetical protein
LHRLTYLAKNVYTLLLAGKKQIIARKEFFYEHTNTKNIVKKTIKENQFHNVGDIYIHLKTLFKDTIQETLEAELDVFAGYPKNEKIDKTDNEHNGYLKRLEMIY